MAKIVLEDAASGGMGRILINASTGVVSLSSGTATEVDLTTIQFRTQL